MEIQKDILLNIDCMEFMRGLQDDCIDLTLTDIPYAEINDIGDGGGLRQIKKGKADEATFDLPQFLEEVLRVTKGSIIIFCARGQLSVISNFFINKPDLTVRQLVWEKTNPSPMNGHLIYLSGIENAIWVRKPKATFNSFCKNTVFRFPSGSSEFHPTEKNHDLLAELINDNSNTGDLIFDPCAGSGSTLLMARKLGRHFIGCELDENYYFKAKKRLYAEVAQTTIFDFME